MIYGGATIYGGGGTSAAAISAVIANAANTKIVYPQDDLLTAYQWLKSSDRDGAMGALSASNRRYLHLMPGTYDITSLSGSGGATPTNALFTALFDTEHVRIVGLGDVIIKVSSLLGYTLPYVLCDIVQNCSIQLGTNQPTRIEGMDNRPAYGRCTYPKDVGTLYTTTYKLYGDDFGAQTNCAKTTGTSGTRSAIFTKNAGTTMLARYGFTGAVDFTNLICKLRFRILSANVDSITSMSLVAYDSAGAQRTWVAANFTPDDYKLQLYGDYETTFVPYSHAYQTPAGFDLTDVVYIGVYMGLHEDHFGFEIKDLEIVELPASKAYWMICFDDCRQSALPALRYLAEKGLRAIMYCFPGAIDRPGRDDYMTWKDVEELYSMGHIIGVHGHDHDVAHWLNAPDRMFYEIQAAQARLTELGFTGGLRHVASPGGRWVWDQRYWELMDSFRVTRWPTRTSAAQLGNVLVNRWLTTDAGDSTTQATTDLGIICPAEGAFCGGGLVNPLFHNFDVTGKPTTAAFQTYIDTVLSLIAAERLIPITPHDLVRGLGKIN